MSGWGTDSTGMPETGETATHAQVLLPFQCLLPKLVHVVSVFLTVLHWLKQEFEFTDLQGYLDTWGRRSPVLLEAAVCVVRNLDSVIYFVWLSSITGQHFFLRYRCSFQSTNNKQWTKKLTLARSTRKTVTDWHFLSTSLALLFLYVLASYFIFYSDAI